MKTALLLLLLLGSIGAFAATLTWTHASIGQPETFTVPSPKGGTLTVTNLPVTFYVYRSLNLSNWTIVAAVPKTNTVVVPTPTVRAFYFVTASNEYSGESILVSPVAVADKITPVADTKITQ